MWLAALIKRTALEAWDLRDQFDEPRILHRQDVDLSWAEVRLASNGLSGMGGEPTLSAPLRGSKTYGCGRSA